MRVARFAHWPLAAALVTNACGSGDAPAPVAEADSGAAPEIARPTVSESDSAGLRVLSLSYVPPADDPDWEWSASTAFPPQRRIRSPTALCGA